MRAMLYKDYKPIAKVGDHITFARPDIHCKRRIDTVIRIREDGHPVCVCKTSKSKVEHYHGNAFDDTVYILTEKEYKALPMFNKEVDYWARLYWED